MITVYTCPSCGHQQPEFFPRCPACGKWLEPDEIGVEDAEQNMYNVAPRTPALSSTESHVDDPPRISSGFEEADRVLGGSPRAGGICEGSAIIFTGAPGVGKSTMLMQIAARVAAERGPVLYISAEESLPQAASRARRIGAQHPDLFILADNGIEEAIHEMKALKAVILVVDSLQLMRTKYCDNPPGSANQVKEVSARIVELAKKSGTPILVAGQIIKSGKFAGPMSVPHLYDGVFHLDEMTLPGFVLLRVEKNRFGAKAEVGSFRMTVHGVEEVVSPSAEILKGGGKGIIAVAMEGTKPIAAEIQVGFLQRGDLSEAVVGYPKERLRLIQTILDQYGIEVPNTIALSVLGGYKISDSAADLAVAIATAHAVKLMSMPKGWGAIGEVALDGRLLPPQECVSRYRELEVLGIENVIVPHIGSDALPPSKKIRTFRAKTLREALRAIGFILETDEASRPKETRQKKAESVVTKTEELEKDRERKRDARVEKKNEKETVVASEPATPPPSLNATKSEPPPAIPTPSDEAVAPSPDSTRPPYEQAHPDAQARPAPSSPPPTPATPLPRQESVPSSTPSTPPSLSAASDPILARVAELATLHEQVTPDLIRRQLNIGLHRAYRLHQQFVGTRHAPSTGGNPE
jgi:DNA repair protein RadA/Sms